MGTRMAANVRRAGFELTVWNRTAATAEQWAARHGAEVADTPAALAARCDIVISMVVDGPQVEAVLLGPDGVAESAHDGLLCIDMSTIGPTAARRIAASLAEKDVRFMDAPVSGSSPKAQEGTLTIMAGGDKSDFERAHLLLEAMGELVLHIGPLGHGQMTKLINNAVAAANAAVMGEALLVGRRAGVDLDALVEVVSAGSGSSAMLELKSAPMRAHDYTTLFKLEQLLKDIRLCLEEAEAVGIRMGFAEPVEEILREASERGFGQDDFAALIEVLEGRAGVRL
jgi:3-hydroxyisobutyrate dehydrogenase-like beta-hydroxyacid dehydrogenase